MTITHPFHPLRGQQVEVIELHHRVGEPDLLIRLPDGSQAFIALTCTNYAGTPERGATLPAPPLLDWGGLRHMVHLIEHLRQAQGEIAGEDRLGEAPPPPKINFQTHSSLTGLKGDP